MPCPCPYFNLKNKLDTFNSLAVSSQDGWYVNPAKQRKAPKPVLVSPTIKPDTQAILVAGKPAERLPEATTAINTLAPEQKHNRRSDGCFDHLKFETQVLAQADEATARIDALAADNVRQYMAMQRACVDLRQLAAADDVSDDTRLLLLGIAADLKRNFMQVQVRGTD